MLSPLANKFKALFTRLITYCIRGLTGTLCVAHDGAYTEILNFATTDTSFYVQLSGS